ncbi:MAG: hypothetical protein U1A77_13135 [Pirellulales bacterium]
MLWIGTDEAGYGPNLGPLVVAASAWEVPELTHQSPINLYDSLADIVVATGSPRSRSVTHLPIADSKILHNAADGVAALERGVFAMAATLGVRPTSWQELWPLLAPSSRQPAEAAPWFVDYESPTPAKISNDEIGSWSERLTQRFTQGPRLVAMRASVVYPDEFNRRVTAAGGKGKVLSNTTLSLAFELLTQCGGGPARISCDKHGGRNRYGELLHEFWPEDWIETREEGREASRYRWGPPERRVEIEFRVGGEETLPCALASMLAKYLRERSMEAFNAFWIARVPGLKPTAGYPVDAIRFRQAIASTQKQLGITDEILWRVK